MQSRSQRGFGADVVRAGRTFTSVVSSSMSESGTSSSMVGVTATDASRSMRAMASMRRSDRKAASARKSASRSFINAMSTTARARSVCSCAIARGVGLGAGGARVAEHSAGDAYARAW